MATNFHAFAFSVIAETGELVEVGHMMGFDSFDAEYAARETAIDYRASNLRVFEAIAAASRIV